MEATKLFLPHMQAIYTRSRIYIGLNRHDILIYSSADREASSRSLEQPDPIYLDKFVQFFGRKLGELGVINFFIRAD